MSDCVSLCRIVKKAVLSDVVLSDVVLKPV